MPRDLKRRKGGEVKACHFLGLEFKKCLFGDLLDERRLEIQA